MLQELNLAASPYSYRRWYEGDRESRNAVKIGVQILFQSKLRDESIRKYCPRYVFKSAKRAAMWL